MPKGRLDREKVKAAKVDVEKCIRKYGLAAVRYIANSRAKQEVIARRLQERKREARQALAEIEAQINRRK